MITVYTFEDANGSEAGWTTGDYREARAYAAKHGYKVIANEYEWTDSEVVDDFTGSEDTEGEADEDETADDSATVTD